MFEEVDIKCETKDGPILGAIAYAGGIFISILAPLLIYLIAKEDKFARFHALQSMIFNVALILICIVLFILYFIISFVTLGFGAILGVLFIPLWLVILVLFIYFAYLAYQGKAFSIPYITEFAMKYV